MFFELHWCMEHLYKVIISVFIVLAISLLSKTKSFLIAGILPLVPVFAIFSQSIIFNDRGPTDLKKSILICMMSLIPYLIYLASMYFSIDRFSFQKSLMISVAIWLVASLPVVYLQRSF